MGCKAFTEQVVLELRGKQTEVDVSLDPLNLAKGD
jgi:hypothetical protein